MPRPNVLARQPLRAPIRSTSSALRRRQQYVERPSLRRRRIFRENDLIVTVRYVERRPLLVQGLPSLDNLCGVVDAEGSAMR
jgi:hypothetical protein